MKLFNRTFGTVALSALTVLIVILAVGAYGAKSAPAPLEEQNKATVNRYYQEVWNQGNLATLDTLVGGAFVDQDECAAEAQAATGDDQGNLKQLIAGVQDSFLNAQITVEDMVAEGDKVDVRWTFNGVFAPSGEKVTFTGNEIWRLENGKIVERWGEFDSTGLLTQLGVIRPESDESAPKQANPSGAVTEGDKEVVIRYYEQVWNGNDLGALDKLVAPRFVDHSPDPGQSPDLAGFKQSVTEFGSGFSNFEVTIDELIPEGDTMRVNLTFVATFKPTGRRVTFTGTETWRVEDGKLVERWGEFDTVGLAVEMGIIPEPSD